MNVTKLYSRKNRKKNEKSENDHMYNIRKEREQRLLDFSTLYSVDKNDYVCVWKKTVTSLLNIPEFSAAVIFSCTCILYSYFCNKLFLYKKNSEESGHEGAFTVCEFIFY